MPVYLEHETHTYINTDKPDLVYKSVTTILGEYKKKFETEKMAARTAKTRGLTTEEVLAEWQQINDDANVFGTAFHEILENYLKNRLFYIPKDDFERHVIQKFVECCTKHRLLKTFDKYNKYKVTPEKILHIEFNENEGIAGTTDVLEDVNDDYFNIFDFKTNKIFNYYSKYNEKLLPPVSHLDHCELNDYTLQISMYALMYERLSGRKFKHGGLFFWDKDAEDFTYYPVTYHRKDVIEMVNHYINKHNITVIKNG